MSLKLDSYLRPFRGKEGEAFDSFWEKFEVLANLQKWDTDAKKMANFPLFLDGDAFLVFTKLSDNQKKDCGEVKKALQSAFAVSRAQAYSLFVKRSLRSAESVDAYVADLNRLLTLSGHKIDDAQKDAVLIEQFVNGLPAAYGRQLRMGFAGKTPTVKEYVEMVRALRLSDACEDEGSAVAGAAMSRSGAGTGGASGSSGGSKGASRLCYLCNEVGHIRKFCPKRKQSGKSASGGGDGSRLCYFCDKPGHTKSECQERKAWLAKKEVAGAVGPQQEPSDPCLCTLDAGRAGGLPRIFVNLAADCTTDDVKWERCRAAIDTGSSRTLITEALASKLDVTPQPLTGMGLVALDGKPLPITASVDLVLERTDGPVQLPRTPFTVLVIESLDVVRADMLLGADLVAAAGGLNLEYSEDQKLTAVRFGATTKQSSEPIASVLSPDEHPLQDVEVTCDGGDVLLSTPDGEARWDSANRRWVMSWKWKDGCPPAVPVGSGIGEYSRSGLTSDQEHLFATEVESWISQGWLVPHDEDVHGPVAGVLPWIAQPQEHKPTTPVRPVMDYRCLNDLLTSQPGQDAPACNEKLRKWRQAGDADDFKLLDIRKAYLQVHVSDDLQKYQAVLWQGRVYIMTRMGFGLSIAPKIMDVIVRWVTREFVGVDNYIDDLLSPSDCAGQLAARLLEYGLPTKPAEPLTSSRVLGLQLEKDESGRIVWHRRDGVDLSLAHQPSKREVFSWCGRLTGHMPVCGWLRVHCSYLKRLANAMSTSWDEPILDPLFAKCCAELQNRFSGDGDPARGPWYGNVTEGTVWTDASDVGLAAVLQCDNGVVEDCAWLRAPDDKHHINVAELEAAIRGLSLAASWQCHRVHLKTDSKTVAGWLRNVLGNVRRVKTKGLHEVLVRRRLQIVADLVSVTGMSVSVEWVASQENLADALTRVPDSWVRSYKTTQQDESVTATTISVVSNGPFSIEQIAAAQQADPVVRTVISQLANDIPVVPAYAKVRSQLVVEHGVLYRSVKLPIEGIVTVPALPESLVGEAVRSAHEATGHASWQTVYAMLRAQCYFPAIASQCEEFVKTCSKCSAANPTAGPSAPPTRSDIPGRPWGEVILDTLELGPDRSSRYHCVLVCVDAFTKWVEVMPLQHHNAASVASAFVSMCARWGAPDVVRMDNGTEFANAVVESIFKLFGVRVRTGAVRHPQSQGSAERFNRSILGLIRKCIDSAVDWKEDLEVLLYHYRSRPHSTIGIAPVVAMVGWQPRQLIVDKAEEACSMSAWAASLSERCARIRDFIEDELSDRDCIDSADTPCLFSVGNRVLLRRPSRHQKCLSPFEAGWQVVEVVSPSTVRIGKLPGLVKTTTVNVGLLKPDPSLVPVPQVQSMADPAPLPSHCDSATSSDSDSVDDDTDCYGESAISLKFNAGDPLSSSRRLRDRTTLIGPARFRD